MNAHKDKIKAQSSDNLGASGEDSAVKFLKIRGYEIVVRNFRTAIGRNRKGVSLTGEIDIIALKNHQLCFIEVKTRSSSNAVPQESVTLRKQRQITRTARAYMKFFDLSEQKHRFDVITVIESRKRAPKIQHLKDFWSTLR